MKFIIILPPPTTATSTVDPLHDTNDSLVVMWIYLTISPKLVEMIVDVDSTAHGVWKRFLEKDIISMDVDRLVNLESPVKDPSLVTYVINGIRSKYPEAARVIRLREKAPTFDELRSMMLLEENDMSHSSHGNSLLHHTSSSPTVLVASISNIDKANTMSTLGLDACRNFQRGSCTYRACCEFVHGANDLRPRPNPTLTTRSNNNVQVKDYQTRRLLLRCDSTDDLYPVTQQPSNTTTFALLTLSPTTWHRRLGHPSDDVLRRKHTKLPFYSSESNVASVFDIIHSDLWTSPISSESGIKYYAIFLDHFSHYVWVYPLLHKSDLFDTFVTFRAYVNKQFNVNIKALQCDNGGEFDNTRFHTLFRQNGIQFRFSCPKTS
ncbi:ribonuclease H-like domain-containing protein [Tanacetum coccineum]